MPRSEGRYARLWERLLEFLDTWAIEVVERPGRLDVTFDDEAGRTRTVEVVMSHDDWDDLVTIPWGEFDLAAQSLQDGLRGLPEDRRFLVYGTYELIPSTSAHLPPDPQAERLAELARRHPEGIGRFVVLDEGNVIDELGPQPPA